MRNPLNISNLVLLPLVMGVVSCHVVETDVPDPRMDGSALSLAPKVNESVVTRAEEQPSSATLHEDYLRTLDVFVEGKDVTYWKDYHLTWETPTIILNNTSIKEQVDQLLADDWQAEGLKFGKHYRIFVAANSSSLTGPGKISSAAALKDVRVADASASDYLWPDGTVDPSKLNLHKIYKEGATASSRIFTPAKEFIMAGMDDDWTPTGTGAQVFYVNLARAASKFVINVKFNEDFLNSLKYEHTKDADGTYNWVLDDHGDKVKLPPAKQAEIFGYPAWRFGNFAFETSVFDPANFDASLTLTPGAGSESGLILSSGALLHDPSASEGQQSSDVYHGNDKHFTITTYSYPNKWDPSEILEKAPAINLSVGFVDGAGNQSYKYYRIPVVSKEVYEIGRNKIYVVNATIASSGSTLLSEAEALILDYEVLPWNEPETGENAPADVKEVKNYFLSVTPQTYTLRGNGSQSVDLVYNLPVGEKIKVQYFNTKEANESVLDGGSPSQTLGTDWGGTYQGLLDQSKKAAWYYNKDKTYRQTFSGNNNVQYGITVNDNDGTHSKGTITVQSDALANKAIKYIAFRVYLDVTDWYAKGLYKDVIIKHFPTDNIQSIEGKWSSRWDGSSSTIIEREYSLTPQAGWQGPITVDCNSTDPGATWTEEDIDLVTFWDQVTYNYYRQQANSKENAFVTEAGYYYWGTGVYEVRNPSISPVNFAYYTGWYDYFYNYSEFHRGHYTRTVYYRDVEVPVSSNGSWIDWENEANTQLSTPKYNYNYAFSADGNNYGGYFAKVYNNGRIYPISVSRTGYNNNRRYTYSQGTLTYSNRYETYIGEPGTYSYHGFGDDLDPDGYDDSKDFVGDLTNNHMYVIQVTKTSDKYVFGRPELDNNYQTKDHVVSPAFMIASQLGAVTTFGDSERGGRNAAQHCRTYMEVAEDGTRYTGWRLPTEEEIDVIVSYQGLDGSSSVVIDGVTVSGDDRVMTPVLTGHYYWTSNGTRKDTGNTSDNNTAVRCIRDLSAAEVEALNR